MNNSNYISRVTLDRFPYGKSNVCFITSCKGCKEIINKEGFEREQDTSLKDRINNAVLKTDPCRMPTKKFWKCKQVEAMKC